MKIRKNPCVYTGKVGARMRPHKPRRPPVKRQSYRCSGGQFHNKWIRLEAQSRNTLPINVGGRCGQYKLATDGNVLTWRPYRKKGVDRRT